MAHVIPLNRTAMLKLLAALVESDKRNSAMRAVTRQHSSELISKRQGEAAHSGVELPKIMVDPVQLQQVFINLMLNAIEAMKDSGGELTVKSQLQDGQLQFSVSDTGVGLPREKVDQIFSAFFTTKPQGSGMGLAISHSIVESHGGRLWATANDGRGATFHFTLATHMTETSSQVNLVTLE